MKEQNLSELGKRIKAAFPEPQLHSRGTRHGSLYLMSVNTNQTSAIFRRNSTSSNNISRRFSAEHKGNR